VVQGHGLDILRHIFPHLFQDSREDVSDLLDDEGMMNNPNVTLKFKDTPDPADAAQILTGLLGNGSGVLSAEDTMASGSGPFWTREG
jgi:hypothetical protein